MNDLMTKWGYTLSDTNEWLKQDWTVRFFGDEVEAFEDPIKQPTGRYYKGNLDKITIESLLQEIDYLLR